MKKRGTVEGNADWSEWQKLEVGRFSEESRIRRGFDFCGGARWGVGGETKDWGLPLRRASIVWLKTAASIRAWSLLRYLLMWRDAGLLVYLIEELHVPICKRSLSKHASFQPSSNVASDIIRLCNYVRIQQHGRLGWLITIELAAEPFLWEERLYDSSACEFENGRRQPSWPWSS